MSPSVNGLLDRAGAAEGIVAVASVFIGTIVALLCFGKLTGDQFVGCFQFLVTTFFGGSALAAFRDSFGSSNK